MSKKEKIVNGALELYMRLGVKSVNMDEVATNLGISKKTLYVYFDNKPIVPSNLTVYGGVPQCTGDMDVRQVCLFVQDSVEGEFTQKLNDKIVSWKST